MSEWIGFLLLHLVLMTWVGVDAERRHRNVAAWMLVIALTGILGTVLWLIVRRRSPAVERLSARRVVTSLSSATLVLLLALIVRTFIVSSVVQTARVEGQAMMPTLADGDRLFVNKAAYRSRAPRHGEIVMFYYPLNPDKTFVLRVLAEPGDQVKIVRGRVHLNELPLEEPYVPRDYRSHENWGPEVIPEGYYFLLADNRGNASDSRHWRWVPKRYIVGRIAFRWWPLSRAGAL
jgi:signal peptidase I